MQRKHLFQLLLAVSLMILPTAAQEGPPSDVARLYKVEAKQGHATQFEEAYKQHLAWHKQQKDTWRWDTWQFITGENYGQYVVRTGNHSWADFDNRGAMGTADEADAVQRLTPHTEKTTSWLSRGLLDISHWPESAPPAMIVVTEYHLNSGADQDWLFAVRKFHEALRKANAPFKYYFAANVAGNEGTDYSLVSPRATWADMNPPEKSFVVIVEGVLGRQETQELLEKFNKAVHCSHTNMLRYRADLSYAPPAM